MNSADRLREELEQEIVSGNLQPGEHLDEVMLANRFEVSRTPIREALQRLSSSGLVELKSRKGAFVRKISFPEMIEMFEVMAELEGMCGRLAARRITEEQVQELTDTMNACESAANSGDTDAYYRANADFHRIIYEACQNRFLAEQTKALHLRLAPYRRLQLRVRHRMVQSLREHKGIADCILKGDSEGAENALNAHVAIQGEKFSDIAATLSAAS